MQKHKFYPERLVLKARELRKEGYSLEKIASTLKVKGGRTTISRWCDGIPSESILQKRSAELKSISRQKSVFVIENLKIDKNTAKILAGIMYWCEGAKYPSTNYISFTNSDVNLVKTFLELFKLGFGVKEENLKARLQLHTTHNVKEVTSFWSKTLKIPQNQFYNPTVTKPRNNMKRQGYKGTCDVRYYDVYLLMEMIGIFEEFAKKFDR